MVIKVYTIDNDVHTIQNGSYENIGLYIKFTIVQDVYKIPWTSIIKIVHEDS
jgi:hypothetical protein